MAGVATSKFLDLKTAILRRVGRSSAVAADTVQPEPGPDQPARFAAPGDGYLAVIRIDRFARLRAAIGYDLAGEVLQQLGERLAERYSEAAVGRLPPDGFSLAFEARGDEAAAEQMARLTQDLETLLHISGGAVSVSVTAGLAQAAVGAAVLEQAGMALEQARADRRKVGVFDPEAYGDPSSNLEVMSGMLWALRAGHIELYHQPKYDLRARNMNSAEALIRWLHPTRGLLRPDLFIPMAEETGHIRTLTDWVLKRAMVDQARMARMGHDLTISINISGRLLADRDFAAFVERTVPEAVGKICFEVTEAAVIDNPALAMQVLERIQAAGVEIAIDNFGAGLSSLACLKQINGHELKIDRSLTSGITESQRDALIVRSIIDLAHGLGLKVTAEGVEKPEAFQLLAAMGCDNIQGFLIAKPMPLSELMAFFTEGRDQKRRFG